MDLTNDEIEGVLKDVFPDFKTETHGGVPFNPRFENIESLKKDFPNGGQEVYFKYKLYELVEKTANLVKEGLL